jgi:crotonobetainyl-CoA:carnitine CoA-transferase CaiB-like acyl-CoA transferase
MGVLDGVRVIELAEHGFVPSCGAVLGDWGAEVIKIERPTGDPLRAVMPAGLVADTGDVNFLWELYNRNKRGLALDLRVPAGRAVFDRLLDDADVLLTSFLPSARDKLGVQPEDCWARNPRLVYARGHGQGQRGPDADHGGFDAVSFWARGGLGQVLTPPEGPLIMQRGAMGDAPSGAMLAGAVAAALFHRERTGKGIVVDVALLNTAVWQLGVDLTATAILREDPVRFDTRGPLPNPLIGPYRTGDSRWLLLNMLDDTRHWAPTCRALGLDDLVSDPRFGDTAARAEHRVELRDLLAARIASLALPELRDRLSEEDTISSALASPLEVVDDPQVLANGYLAAHPTRPSVRLACAPMQFDNEMTAVRRPAPDTGEHTDEILGELGYDSATMASLREAGAIA